jgi:hypothetical protein
MPPALIPSIHMVGSTDKGAAVDPDRYDYRRAARDAIHFPALVDLFWQNTRRCVGWDVQYFGTVEPRKRGAPHFHAAIRGAIPAPSYGRSPRTRTTRCGGHPMTSWSTAGNGCHCGTAGPGPSLIPTLGSRCRPSTRHVRN